MQETISQKLAHFVCNEAPTLATEAVRERARLAILDTLAVTIAGGRDPAVQSLEASLDGALATGCCPSPWTGARYNVLDAAVLYGMASHMDDYDDVSMLAVCHPSAPVLSALIAAELGDAAGESSRGRDFVTAFAIGTEVAIRLGQAMGFRHYELGFHATSTLGVVGAAAAIARLMRLDAGATRNALAIAASMAAGVRKNFGTAVKPLHVGLAASNALRAAQLARAGLDGATEAFEQGGYLCAYSGGRTDRFPADGPTFGRPFALEQPGFEQKRYPCCYMLHKIIEAALALHRESGCMLKEVERAHVRMPKGGTKPLIHPYPGSGLNGKFSAPYAVAASLADGRINLASFTDEAVRRSELQAHLRDVEIVEDSQDAPPGSDLGRMPVTLTLTLRDGRVLQRTVVASPGSPEDPLTTPQLRGKWLDCLRHGRPELPSHLAHTWFDQGMDLDREDRTRDWLLRVLSRRGPASRASST